MHSGEPDRREHLKVILESLPDRVDLVARPFWFEWACMHAGGHRVSARDSRDPNMMRRRRQILAVRKRLISALTDAIATHGRVPAQVSAPYRDLLGSIERDYLFRKAVPSREGVRLRVKVDVLPSTPKLKNSDSGSANPSAVLRQLGVLPIPTRDAV